MECAEKHRLRLARLRKQDWKKWGPYLPERQWGTVREDDSEDGNAWASFTHDQARSRPYRWGEDGLLGWTDRQCRICFSLALWNGVDPILKERLFGLSNVEGNHGEDVKECYYYLDGTPSHSYMKALYKYPQRAFPYQELVEQNARRSRDEREYELLDTGIFDDNRYFDVQIEYAKGAPDHVNVLISVSNRGPDRARLTLLPQLWFRNTWSWGRQNEDQVGKGCMRLQDGAVQVQHPVLGDFRFRMQGPKRTLFTENEEGQKDAFHRAIVEGEELKARQGSKAAFVVEWDLKPGETRQLRVQLHHADHPPRASFGQVLRCRRRQADAFYAALQGDMPAADALVHRQALAGLLWSKKFYCYSVYQWQSGDPNRPRPQTSMNRGWADHLYNRDVLLMPDSWEFPWYASWDLGFHVLPLADVDPDWRKSSCCC